MMTSRINSLTCVFITAVEIIASPESAEAIVAGFELNKVKVKSVSIESNKSVALGFLTLQQAEDARKSFFAKDTHLKLSDGSRVAKVDLSQVPSYAVELHGLDPETSCKQLLESIELGFEALKVDRSAILKAKRHLEVCSFSVDTFTPSISPPC